MLQERYNLTGEQIRAGIEGYARLAQLQILLGQATTTEADKLKLAKRVINEDIPFYKNNVPKDLQGSIHQIVNVGCLEDQCLKILSEEEHGER
mgnify:CR=1 FL=1